MQQLTAYGWNDHFAGLLTADESTVVRPTNPSGGPVSVRSGVDPGVGLAVRIAAAPGLDLV